MISDLNNTITQRRQPAKASVGGYSGGLETPLSVIAITWLLIGPRITILSIASSSIRFEDFILLVIGFRTLTVWHTIKRERLLKPGIGAIIGVALIASVMATATHTSNLGPDLLYSFRLAEYWTIYPYVAFLLHRERGRTLLWITRALALVTILNTTTSGLQYIAGVDIGFSKFSDTRGAGLTAGPYELGAMTAMLGVFWLDRKRYALFSVALVGLFMSLSRVSIAGIGIGLIAYYVLKSKRSSIRPKVQPAVVVGACVVISALLILSPLITERIITPSISRLGGTSLVDSWQTAASVVARTPGTPTSDEYLNTAYGDIAGYILDSATGPDVSNVVRFYRWQLLLREVNSSPARMLIGLGPSFPGPSVDGSYLRVYVTTGLAGLLTWLMLFVRWVRRSPAWFVAATITLLVGSLFIDLFYALRPMVLLWLLYSIAQSHIGSGADEPAGTLGIREETEPTRRRSR